MSNHNHLYFKVTHDRIPLLSPADLYGNWIPRYTQIVSSTTTLIYCTQLVLSGFRFPFCATSFHLSRSSATRRHCFALQRFLFCFYLISSFVAHSRKHCNNIPKPSYCLIEPSLYLISRCNRVRGCLLYTSRCV